MNHEELSKNRQEALRWWRNLSHLEKQEFAKSIFQIGRLQ